MPTQLIDQQEFRANILAYYGANPEETQELLAYNQNIFDHTCLKLPLKFPLPSFPHIAAWEEYVTAGKEIGAFAALRRVLVQLRFPILEGISQTEAYRSATRKGVSVDGMAEATGLLLKQPERLQLTVHQSLAGAIPVLLTGNREDFVSLVQALTMRNEPSLVPASMGACIVAGFNNWDRIRRYRKQWQQNSPNCSEAEWTAEFKRLIPQKELYQDQFIILSDGDYSNVSASDVGLSKQQWRHLSLTIRLEHECTHYFTRCLFNSMRNNLLDELIADYRGIVAAIGNYRADWFLRFLGLESFPDYREGGRLQNYRGQPPLSNGAFKILQILVKNAAENLQRFDAELNGDLDQTDTTTSHQLTDINRQTLILIALTCLTLEELASEEANLRIQKNMDRFYERSST
ncbi:MULTISPECIES: DUF7005 family protein [unclassified Nostoc]|uniref:DUF7005 family protein n=1 Tax=unclassified Nostoc TaxID=2593658 RepID=UPI002AD3961D|nr:hypothetical protein [Nostoc sp. DedQUE03]MDZ7971112.1 hypothetical protein [Nostoc sp. DedQUE03]MDZ8046732.1 hypothetical protein [Nostoc sp. DedQUE02]